MDLKQRFFLIAILAATLGAFFSCATAGGVDYGELAAQGVDVFAGKNWNAPRRNNMYDRWEFGADGTFHFWHVHHGEPLDRGVYRYEAKDGTITITKEGEHTGTVYAYAFNGKTVTLTPVKHSGGGSAAAAGAASGGTHGMGALPEEPVTFTHAK
jgi:hypothetical protein